jgi:hypothetical protein
MPQTAARILRCFVNGYGMVSTLISAFPALPDHAGARRQWKFFRCWHEPVLEEQVKLSAYPLWNPLGLRPSTSGAIFASGAMLPTQVCCLSTSFV